MTLPRKTFRHVVSSLFACLLLSGVPPAYARELSVDERVEAQKAIEQVYWNHRIWPKENPGPKPPLAAVMSDEAIRAKVEDYLRKSNALETWWQRPVTAQQLQAELDRMAKNTRDGETLQDLYRSLGNDPFVIAETLGRQTLAERSIRNWYANDSRFHGDLKMKAEAALRACTNLECMQTMGGEYRETTRKLRDTDADAWKKSLEHLAAKLGATVRTLPAGRLSGLEETPDAFVVTAVRRQSESEIATVDVVWPKRTFDSWWSETRLGTSVNVLPEAGQYAIAPPLAGACVNDSWASLPYVPEGSSGNTAVWTGTEMIVWGGWGWNTGGRYNPSTDSWTATSTGANVPSERQNHTAVWTGTVMIVWGGDEGVVARTGGRYNPSTDSWATTSTGANVPLARQNHTAVWTGTEMIVWGGIDDNYVSLNSGGRYNPSTNKWTTTSTGANVPDGRRYHTAVWTGTEMIVWGGFDENAFDWLNTGGRYSPSTNQWTATTTGANVPEPRRNHTAVWTGTEMIVWGGDWGSVLNTGGRYRPSTDSWVATSTGPDVPSEREYHTAVWTGTEMIVWGGDHGQGGFSLETGGRYNPSQDVWAATSVGANVPQGRKEHTAVWTGTEMIVWGGGSDTGGRYNPSTDSWIATYVVANAPAARSGHTAVWTGAEMIVWGGNYDSNTGGRYNPSTDSWIATSTDEATVPSARSDHAAVWTGLEMVVWGGSDYLNTGGRYDPATDRWRATSTGANVPAPRRQCTAVWTGTEMIVWGGGYVLNTGGRYRPSTDSWLATSTGANVPAARYLHTAVWTGTEMIVWGGQDSSLVNMNTGGRYNPTTNSWTATSTGANVPAARQLHAGVWTGAVMVVWGGRDANFSNMNTGGRFNPATNSWTATSTGANTPEARQGHTAVWTGSEMIVWGGATDIGLDTGGRFNPASNSWTATSTGANTPLGRWGHTAVWSGAEMIVWGGAGNSNPGLYCACPNGRINYRDADGDGYGNPSISIPSCDGSIPAGYVANPIDCNDQAASVHPGATETCNAIDDDCDGLFDESASGEDTDGDSFHDLCDNCRSFYNPAQSDLDHDAEGDACDLDDGLIFEWRNDTTSVSWQAEQGPTSWNVYIGDLDVLKATGMYTQAPGSNAIALRHCGETSTVVADPGTPTGGKVAFSLVTGVTNGVEGSLGPSTSGPRLNTHPCP